MESGGEHHEGHVSTWTHIIWLWQPNISQVCTHTVCTCTLANVLTTHEAMAFAWPLFSFPDSEHEVNRAWPQLREKMRIWRSQHRWVVTRHTEWKKMLPPPLSYHPSLYPSSPSLPPSLPSPPFLSLLLYTVWTSWAVPVHQMTLYLTLHHQSSLTRLHHRDYFILSSSHSYISECYISSLYFCLLFSPHVSFSHLIIVVHMIVYNCYLVWPSNLHVVL